MGKSRKPERHEGRDALREDESARRYPENAAPDGMEKTRTRPMLAVQGVGTLLRQCGHAAGATDSRAATRVIRASLVCSPETSEQADVVHDLNHPRAAVVLDLSLMEVPVESANHVGSAGDRESENGIVIRVV